MRTIVRRCGRRPARGAWNESRQAATIRVVGGDELATHQAFWFAWTQFHAGTDVWRPPGG